MLDLKTASHSVLSQGAVNPFIYIFNIREVQCGSSLPDIGIINNKAWHNLINAKCRWHSDQLDGDGSFMESLGQMKVMQIHQTTHEICCLVAQLGK